MGRDVVKWFGAVLAVVGTAAFAYGLVVLISNGSCGCSDTGFDCAGPPCPPGDATGRLQELDALKAQGVVNVAEYAAQRQRILDSI